MTFTEITHALNYGWPGANWTLRGDNLHWEAPEGPPTEAQLEAAWLEYETGRQLRETAEAAQEAAGIQALIDSVSAPDPDRTLNPAQVRFGLAMIVKAMTRTEPVVLSTEQRSTLEGGIHGLLNHLQNQA